MAAVHAESAEKMERTTSDIISIVIQYVVFYIQYFLNLRLNGVTI